MKLSSSTLDGPLPHATRRLAERMISPLCGLDKMMNFMLPGRLEPRFVVAGAELTGVHVLLNQPEPPSYHIGGSGILLHEAVIRSLGESVERYSQFIAPVAGIHTVTMASYDDMVARGHPVLHPDKLRFFSAEQYDAPCFRFQPFDPTADIGWVKAVSCHSRAELWVPAQLVLVGYAPRRHEGEPWMMPAVTTGSAAHTDETLALRSALLELIQLDAVMGHWYTDAKAPRIALDARTRLLAKVIERHFRKGQEPPRFYWLPSKDLAGLIVACVLYGAARAIPAAAVGLGSDVDLESAMYKALLEAVGVRQFAKLTLVSEHLAGNSGGPAGDPARFMDLDSNVAFYARPTSTGPIRSKFDDTTSVAASELPPDSTTGPEGDVHELIDSFARNGKELLYLDLTTTDIRELGFVAVRVWSPDTLGLALPAAPPVAHSRFEDYGGVGHFDPHPYP